MGATKCSTTLLAHRLFFTTVDDSAVEDFVVVTDCSTASIEDIMNLHMPLQ